MNKLKKFALALGLSMSAFCIHAGDYVFSLTAQQSESETALDINQITTFFTNQEAGSTAIFIDGDNLKPLGKMVIPDGRAYQSPKARLLYNKKVVASLVTYIKSSQPVAQPNSSLPDILRYISDNVATGHPMDVVILNNVLYHDANQPLLSFHGGRFPSDGYLSAERHKSVFAVSSGDPFKDVSFHFDHGDSRFYNDTHEVYVKRFWQLFITRQGGTMNSWVGDLTTVLNNVARKAKPLAEPVQAIDGIAEDKLEYIHLRAAQAAALPLFERSVSTLPMTAKDLRHAQALEIGIKWGCKDCDYDIHVKPTSSAPPIYFGAPKSPYGELFKDYTNGHSLHGFETITFHQAMDLRAVSIYVNFYRGIDPNAAVDVRISLNGETYSQRFEFNAEQGNGGEDVGHVMRTQRSSEYTLFINPASFM